MRFVSGTTVRWIIVVPVSLALGWIFDIIGVPAGWIVAGILAAGGSALISGEELPVNKTLYTFGAGIVSVLAAVPIFNESAANLVRYLLPSLVVAAFTICFGLLGGFLLSKFQRSVSKETGMISMLAGGAAFMPAIAKEIGADIRFVSLTQYLRLLAVALSLPLVTHLLPHDEQGTSIQYAGPEQTWWMVALIALIALVGGPIAAKIKLPVSSILGPLLISVAVLTVSPLELNLNPPEALRILAFLSIGWLCGGTMSKQALKNFARQLPAIIFFIVVLIGGCALLAIFIAQWVGISYFDAYLATSPGAMDTVLAISSETGTSPAVVTIQLIRMVLIVLVASMIPRILQLFKH